MSTTFIAVVIIMVLLIGFVLIIIESLAGSAGVRIRADMVKLLESYDKVIETKSREVRRLQAEAETLRTSQRAAVKPERGEAQAGGSASRAPIPRTASYRSGMFSDGYSAVREHFRLNGGERETLVAHVAQCAAEETPGRGGAAARLREELSFDTVFRLSQLRGEAQLEILDTTLDDEGWSLLRDFCEEQEGKPFETGRFCHWLMELEELEGDGLSVRCGGAGTGEQEDVEHEEGICEGVQIVSGGRLYDYSIQEREIG